MKKQRKNAGFSLIEMLCALLILVLLVIGIGISMDAGSKIYNDSIFESESATLAGILNTSLGDILRYSIKVREPTQKEIEDNNLTDVDYVFTSLDYGIQDAYFYTPPHENGGSMGVLQMKNLKNGKIVELVNSGAYPDLAVSNFEIEYSPRVGSGTAGGYFDISYTIYSESNMAKSREVSTIVRLMNDD